jgi:signal transduction histidine kinase
MTPFSPNDLESPARQSEEHLQLLIQTGLLLASECSLDRIVEAALDAGLRLSGARFGGFYYNSVEGAESFLLHQTAGLDMEAFNALPLPRPAQIIDGNLPDAGIIRSADLPLDSRFSHNLPATGVPVRSYLAVPVRGRSGDVLGALLYGHPEANVFEPISECLVSTIAHQAGVAIENVRLAESLRKEIALLDASRTLQLQTAKRLRQALEAEQLGTWEWDRSTDLVDLDERAARMLHAQPHVPIKRSVLHEHLVDERDTASDNIELALQSGGLYSAEYRIDHPSGLQSWVCASGLATFAPNSSTITGMVGTVHDVTLRKSQESSLRQSEKLAATGRLAATIAHEINNPLEAITNLIYLSRTDPEVPQRVQRLLETADMELGRVSQIAQQTLGFYRDTISPADIDLNELLQSVVELFARKMSTHKIDYTLDLEPDLCVHGLKGEIRQVFSNLIVNAIDASTTATNAGTLRIRGRHLRGQRTGVSVLISDQGSGIPQHVRHRVFSPFFTTKQSVGTGLGLWVTRGFVDKHGGSIRFRTCTDRPSGTTFRILLPRTMPCNTLDNPSAQYAR